MLKESVTLDEVIVLLNETLASDPEAMRKMVSDRVPCNAALAGHPTIQVHSEEGKEGSTCVGLLGMVNGIFGVDADGWGAVAVVVETDGRLVRFERTNRKWKQVSTPDENTAKAL